MKRFRDLGGRSEVTEKKSCKKKEREKGSLNDAEKGNFERRGRTKPVIKVIGKRKPGVTHSEKLLTAKRKENEKLHHRRVGTHLTS